MVDPLPSHRQVCRRLINLVHHILRSAIPREFHVISIRCSQSIAKYLHVSISRSKSPNRLGIPCIYLQILLRTSLFVENHPKMGLSKPSNRTYLDIILFISLSHYHRMLPPTIHLWYSKLRLSHHRTVLSRFGKNIKQTILIMGTRKQPLFQSSTATSLQLEALSVLQMAP